MGLTDRGTTVLKLNFDKKNDAPLSLLCLGAHSDDIEIGCGGTLLRILEEYAPVDITWVVLSAKEDREVETLKSSQLFQEKAVGRQNFIHNFRDGFLPYHGSEVKEFFEQLKSRISPDLIFTHYRQDLHQDHRLVSELTWNTFRNHCILEYEVFKYDGDLGNPSCYFPLTETVARRKLDYIKECYRTQWDRTWFNEKIFWALMSIRGVECNAPEKLAEAFYCRKMVV